MYSEKRHGMGWIPDYPDFRDYTGPDQMWMVMAGAALRRKNTLLEAKNIY
jgi:hypothetical protein